MLLLLTGMETDLRLVRRVGRACFSISAAGVAAPFALGFVAAQFMPASLLATGGELTIENDPDHEAVDVAWVPLKDLPRRLSFPNERRIAELAREVIESDEL